MWVERFVVFRRPKIVHLRWSILATALACACSATGRPQTEPGSSVLVARGVLSQNGNDGTLWVLKTSDSPKFRDELILEVTFTTRPGTPTQSFVPFAEKQIELTGEVKSVLHGNAVLSKVLLIGVIPSPLASLASLPASLSAATGLPATPGSSSTAEPRIRYRHAYYLFLSGAPAGCEPCYVPLLITQRSLETIAAAADPALAIFITTYERDSIWSFRGAALLQPAEIDPHARSLRASGRIYRYQEITVSEVRNLLEHPAGTIPISRPMLTPKEVPGASLRELISDFRSTPPQSVETTR